ncbi:MAG TPA: peptide chain release factor N(5)-glutamine methyltransferase [Brumimicrobium sp.]|nr:peptide chain release factor N(5)-glutamine methyltransferase [Brumimicrobium sp.]
MNTVNEMLLKFSGELNDSFSTREKKQIAKMFLMHYLSYDGTELLLNKDNKVSDELVERLNHAISEINKGRPVQYVLGSTHFYGLDLNTDRRALIPRPETEELVDWIIDLWKGRSPKILDVGTGSGCIALAIKANMSKSHVFGIDVIQNALDLAIENAKRLSLDVTFEFANAMNLHAYSRYKWDVIVSNPPYIPIDEKSEMKDHVVDFEPGTALFVPNENPLLFYKAIALYAKDHLVPKGSLFFEVHENLSKDIKRILNNSGFTKVEIKKDLQDKDRMIHAQF